MCLTVGVVGVGVAVGGWHKFLLSLFLPFYLFLISF